MVQKFNIGLKKTIYQVRFKPLLSYYNDMFDAAMLLQSNFPDWQTDRLKITLQNYEKHHSVDIGHNTVTYEQDSSDVSDEKKIIATVNDELLKALKVKEITRLGFRRKYIIPVDMQYDELVAIVKLKFDGDSKFLSSLPADIVDLHYFVDLKDEEGLYHLKVGPVNTGQLDRVLEYNKDRHLRLEDRDLEYKKIVDKWPESALFVDIDFFKDNELSLKSIDGFYALAQDSVERHVKSIRDFIFSL